MDHQYTIIFVILSIAFALTFIGNFLLAIMIVKLKRQHETAEVDRRRHFDVLFTALAVGDIVGSCLNYPMLFYLYDMASQENEISRQFCKILGSSAAFYFSFIATLTAMMNLHNFASITWPFHYYLYLRRKSSKIPTLCVSVSVFIALLSLVLSASGVSFFNLTAGRRYFRVSTCIPDSFSSSSTPSKYYFFIIAHLSFWTHFFLFILTTCQYVEMRANAVGRIFGGNQWLGLPHGAWFAIAFKLLYLTFWTPFIVVMTIVTCSSYRIPSDVLVTACYLVFLPGIVGPFVHYVTHRDLRDVFNTTIRNLVLKGDQERENDED